MGLVKNSRSPIVLQIVHRTSWNIDDHLLYGSTSQTINWRKWVGGLIFRWHRNLNWEIIQRKRTEKESTVFFNRSQAFDFSRKQYLCTENNLYIFCFRFYILVHTSILIYFPRPPIFEFQHKEADAQRPRRFFQSRFGHSRQWFHESSGILRSLQVYFDLIFHRIFFPLRIHNIT